MNITVLSYAESVSFGIVACERSVPHAGNIALGFGSAVGHLLKLALEKTSERLPLAGEGAEPDPDLVSATEN